MGLLQPSGNHEGSDSLSEHGVTGRAEEGQPESGDLQPGVNTHTLASSMFAASPSLEFPVL